MLTKIFWFCFGVFTPLIVINGYLQMIKTLEIDTDLIIYAFRYCLGRQTYCVLTMTEQLTKHWQELEPKDRTLIKREIRERENPIYDGNGLGDPNIDKPYWLKILELPD